MISRGKPYLEQEQTFGSPKDQVARWSRQAIDGQDKWLPSSRGYRIRLIAGRRSKI